MTILTPYEYDWVLDDAARAALSQVVRQPMNDQHGLGYRRVRGRFMNGDPGADVLTYQRVGYGTGSPLVPRTLIETVDQPAQIPPVTPNG